jgi:hypothetical protein
VDQNLLIIEASRSHADTTLGRTPLDEWSARHRDLYLQAHNIHTIQISMPPGGGFEPTIPARERPQTHALGHVATGICTFTCIGSLKNELKCSCGTTASYAWSWHMGEAREQNKLCLRVKIPTESVTKLW